MPGLCWFGNRQILLVQLCSLASFPNFIKDNEQNNLIKGIDCQEISGKFIRSITAKHVRMYNLSWFSGDEHDRSQKTSA